MYQNSIIVTGGCGFIGTALISRILHNNLNVNIRVLDNFVNGKPEDLTEVVESAEFAGCEFPWHRVELIEGDIRDLDVVMRSVQDVDYIVHLAANTGVSPSVGDPRHDLECNVLGTFNVLEAARFCGVKKFVFASSGAPAGEVEPPIHEELPPHPVSPYGASKLAGEGYCSAYYRTFGIDTVCLRFGNVYGPRSKKKSSVVAKFIRQALKGKACEIYGDGTQTRDFIYVDDLVQAILLALEKDMGGETFQIATGTERTVGEVAKLIAMSLRRRGIQMDIKHAQPRLGDVKRNFSDTTKSKNLLGWKANVSLEEGVERTIDYFLGLA